MALRIITAPAKKMRVSGAPPWPVREPAFLARTEELMRAVQALSRAEAQALWRCSDALADQNYERFRHMDLTRNTTAAVVAYEGIQYRHLAPEVMSEDQLAWLDAHLRILSGFYGMHRPLDGVVPYRLEMGARLAVGGTADLYGFWGRTLYDALAAELTKESEAGVIVNVASVEYARAVTPWAGGRSAAAGGSPRVLTCLFGELRDGRLRQVSTEAKAARGTFVRWCAERGVESPEELAGFAERGYALDEGRSDGSTLTFVRETH